MLAHAKEPGRGGSRVAIIMNGSPLFTGDAGSGESEIRRWILENDLLEALIALPEQLFYNTGIATYVWVLTNRKRPGAARQGPANRRHLVLGPAAQEPGRQAPRGAVRAEAGRTAAAGRLRGRRHPQRSTGTAKQREVRRQPRLSSPRTSASARSRSNGRSGSISRPAPSGSRGSTSERAFANLAVSRKRGEARARDEEAGRKQQDKPSAPCSGACRTACS